MAAKNRPSKLSQANRKWMKDKLFTIRTHYENHILSGHKFTVLDLANLSVFFLLFCLEFGDDDALLLGIQMRGEAIDRVGPRFSVESYQVLGILQKWCRVDPSFTVPVRLLSRSRRALPEVLNKLDLSRRYDLLAGIAGIVLAFDHQRATTLRENPHRFLIRRLKKMGVRCSYVKGQGLRHKDAHEFILGIAHGLAGVLLAANQNSEASAGKSDTAGVLKQFASFLGHLDDANGGLSLPIAWKVDPEDRADSLYMNSWCNGDAGIGFALGQTSLILKDKDLLERADRILKRALKPNCERVENMPTNFCCGIAGMAQICLISRKHFGFPNWSTCATWLGALNTKDRLAKQEDGTSETLHGLLGTALVLFSYYAKDDLSWSDFLLGAPAELSVNDLDFLESRRYNNVWRQSPRRSRQRLRKK